MVGCSGASLIINKDGILGFRSCKVLQYWILAARVRLAPRNVRTYMRMSRLVRVRAWPFASSMMGSMLETVFDEAVARGMMGVPRTANVAWVHELASAGAGAGADGSRAFRAVRGLISALERRARRRVPLPIEFVLPCRGLRVVSTTREGASERTDG
jgi:hypothetical protein